MEYTSHGITSPELLEMAVLNMGYPPVITCVLVYRKELRRTGRPVWVCLDLTGAGKELTFMCKAYEEVDKQLDRSRNGELEWTNKATISIFSTCSTALSSRVQVECTLPVLLMCIPLSPVPPVSPLTRPPDMVTILSTRDTRWVSSARYEYISSFPV